MSGGNFSYSSGVLTILAEDIEETFKKYEKDYVGTAVPALVSIVAEQLRKLEPHVNSLDKLIGGDIGVDTCKASFETTNNGEN